VPDGVIDAVPILPCFSLATYGPFLEAAAERALLLPFGYDWRRDARETSRALRERLESLAGKRVVLVGHSLGGLISLHAVRHGAKVSKLVLVGAPFGGSPSFLQDIALGDTVGRNRVLLAREAFATWPSAFQLLPLAGKCFVDPSADLDDLSLWKRNGWSVPDAPLERMLEARRAFRRELDEGDASVETLVALGTGRPTVEKVGLPDFASSVRVSGDGRVTESSARPSRLSFEEVQTQAEHGKILSDREIQERIWRFIL